MVFEYKSDKLLAVFVGLITGTIGFFMLVMYIVLKNEEIPVVMAILGVLLLIASISSFGYRNVVRIDTKKKTIERKITVLFWSKSWQFDYKDFHRIGIATAGDPSGRRTRTKYFIQLEGNKTLKIPKSYYNYDRILLKAKEITKITGLPLDEKPGIGFFGKRL